MRGRIHVDVRASCSLLGTVLKYLSLTLLFPTAIALYYRESPVPFLLTLLVAVAIGAGLERLEADPDLEHREAFLLVSLTWLVVPLVGMLPYLVAGTGTIADPVNAFFESMSGFTTTGATVMGDISVDTHSRSILMWRQLTQWLGGMGILVLMVAILSVLSVGGTQLIREESPGLQVEKLTPRIRETARALWLIYAWFTLAAVVVYYGLHLAGLAPNMDFYNAVAHALTSLPTGGFSPEGRSVEAFSPIVQWAVMFFMIVAGTNFALYWYAWHGRFDRLIENAEFRAYLLAMGVVGGLLSALLFLGVGLAAVPEAVAPIPGSLERSLRHGLFQSLAIVTTTGYASMDFNTWSESTQMILIFAMFLGGSAGSAAGSIKIVRWYVIRKSMRRELFRLVHPQAVRPIRMGGTGEVIDEETIHGIFVFVALFLTLFVVSTVLLLIDAHRTPGLSLSALEAVSAVIATLGNVGPGVGVVGPMNSYEPFSDAAKLYMVFLMWIGRLEILSVLVILTPAYWQS
ncbi:TrkH family potassium uptake protein [Natrinema sp. 1APR25-10V2]|uniref:TrkH family potassium uptake protein n=1 Tax=Natrinema sp. 1APR25-10V2 TaxID=2951081 RepID=UPI002876E398|nr:TrkH family potassium uptake protein [Natrinema sp. 1APR25-10V2]MDS0477779.1 TrkH family potassium uptake protein [Natrinema sp. 1APR25-10V2]